MVSMCASLIFVLGMVKLTFCERRIVNGTISVGEPRFLTYFIRAPKSEIDFKGWVCGGTIIHPLYVLTSAACLEDMRYVYVIAGYNRYVRSEDIDKDDCTKRTKKKVVARSFQKEINAEDTPHKWSSRDISLAKVDTPYDFRDPVYVTFCSYSPGMIRVNFNINFEEPGTQAVTFGWGTKKYYRQVGDVADHNEEYVNYASTVLIDKESCKQLLFGHTDVKIHVNLYLLCTAGPGSLDENGKLKPDDLEKFNSTNCLKRATDLENATQKVQRANDSYDFYMTSNSLSETPQYRRNGPCQNDHGGPLVSWIGGREYVIGVACGFQVNKDMECVGPYLYTSTYSNGEFIYCMLRYTRRSKLCDIAPEQREYQIIEEEILWETKSSASQRLSD